MEKALQTMLEETANLGMEEVTADDLQMPFLRVVQAMSPELNKKESAYIEGVNQGDIFNTVTRQYWKGDEGVMVIPVYYQLKYLEFVPRTAGGGFVGEINPQDPQLQGVVRDENNLEMLKSGNELVKTAQHYVKIVHQKGKDEYDLESAVVDLKKTGLKKSRNWNSIMSMQKVNGKTMASFANIYTLTTISEGNDKGSWFTLNPQHKMVIPSIELLTECKEFHQAISDGQVKLAIPSQEPELLESSKEAENSPF